MFDRTTPYYYEVPHSDDEECWCYPEVEDYGEGMLVITHTSGVC